MVSGVIERVARAICSFEGNREDSQFEGKPMWMSYVEQAAPVITVMRDPSEEMLDAATLPALSRDVEGVWRAMIDAALAEEV